MWVDKPGCWCCSPRDNRVHKTIYICKINGPKLLELKSTSDCYMIYGQCKYMCRVVPLTQDTQDIRHVQHACRRRGTKYLTIIYRSTSSNTPVVVDACKSTINTPPSTSSSNSVSQDLRWKVTFTSSLYGCRNIIATSATFNVRQLSSCRYLTWLGLVP